MNLQMTSKKRYMHTEAGVSTMQHSGADLACVNILSGPLQVTQNKNIISSFVLFIFVNERHHLHVETWTAFQ